MFLRLFALSVVCIIATAHSAPKQQVVLSAGNKLTVFRLNAETGTLTAKQEVDLLGAGPFTASADGKFLYVSARQQSEGQRKPTPAIATFALLPGGKISHLRTASVQLGLGYLDINQKGTLLVGNNYKAGTASVWQLKDGQYTGETLHELPLEPRAHSAIFSPTNKWVLVPATQPNKVFVNRIDEQTGQLTPKSPGLGPTASTAARQPRHLIFHPTLPICYTTNERENPGVCTWSWDEETGTLKALQNIVTQPAGYTGRISTADLHLTPNGRFLYVSNRDIGDADKNSIVGFSVAKNGTLRLIDYFPCEKIPRSFHVDRTGRFVCVAGQGSAKLGVYQINQKNGRLSSLAQYDTGSRPTWVECLTW